MSFAERAIHSFLRPPHDVGVDNRRRTGRVAVKGVRSSVGEIIDLSAGGARLQRRRPWPIGTHKTIAISDTDNACLLTACCVWANKAGLFRHVVGIEFQEVTPEQAAVLAGIARRGSTQNLHPGIPR